VTTATASTPIFISIAGLIGAGKTTLADKLGERMGLDVYHEPVADNEYLADFYRDMRSHSFAMQVYLLNCRFQQHQEIIWRGRPAIQDRTIYEDGIFAGMLAAQGLMDERDYRTYSKLFEHMSNFMRRPTLIVFLDVRPQTSLRRIRDRDRGVESGITLEYLEALQDHYEHFILEISRSVPVIRVPYEHFHCSEDMAEMIVREVAEVRYHKTVVPRARD